MEGRHRFKVGDRVVFCNTAAHRQCPRWYPPAGTVGRVVQVGTGTVRVQWPAGCTGGNGRWYAPLCEVEPCRSRMRRALAAVLRRLRGREAA